MNWLAHRFAHWLGVRLSHTIIFPAVLVTLLFMGALSFVSFRVGQSAVEEQINTRNQDLARLVAQDVSSFFQTLLDAARLQSPLLVNNDDPDSQAAALVELRRVFPQAYTRLWLLDMEGRQLVSLTESSRPGETFRLQRFDPPQVLGIPDSLRADLNAGRLSVSEAGFRPITGWPYITATLPLATGPRTSSNVLLAEIDLRSFWRRVDSIFVEQGNISIVDSQGIILAHSDRQMVGQQLDIDAISPVFEGFEDTTVYVRDGENYLAAFSPVRGNIPWAVVVSQREAAALAPVETIGTVALAVIVLSSICTTVLLSGIVRRAVEPIEHLSKAAATIASSGDVQSDWRGDELLQNLPRNEVGALAVSFDQMLDGLQIAQDKLKRWNEMLEQRVQERTAELHSVLEVARLSGETLREEEVMATTLEQLQRVVRYDSATILLLDGSGTSLKTAAILGALPTLRRTTRSLDTYPLNQQVIEQRAPVLVYDTSREPRWRNLEDHQPIVGSWLAAPLLVHDRAIGLIGLLSYEVNFYTLDDIRPLTALANQVAVMLAHARLYEESVRRVERELQQAEQVQRHLFPTTAPDVVGLTAAAFFRPARETTGDFYEFVLVEQTLQRTTSEQWALLDEDDAALSQPLAWDSSAPRSRPASPPAVRPRPPQPARPDLALGVVIGDVSGKSLPAALMMAMARTALRASVQIAPGDPAGVLRLANATLLDDIPKGSFVACSYAVFDRSNLTLALTNAAQPAPLLLRGTSVTLLEGVGSHIPLGIIPVSDYETALIALQPGDVVIFYTDGVVEAHNEQHELFGFEQLGSVVQTQCADPALTPQQIITRILDAVDSWAGDMPQSDDIALLVVRVTEDDRPR